MQSDFADVRVRALTPVPPAGSKTAFVLAPQARPPTARRPGAGAPRAGLSSTGSAAGRRRGARRSAPGGRRIGREGSSRRGRRGDRLCLVPHRGMGILGDLLLRSE